MYIPDILTLCFILLPEAETDVSLSTGRIVLALVSPSADFTESPLTAYTRVWCNDVRLLTTRKPEGIIPCNCQYSSNPPPLRNPGI